MIQTKLGKKKRMKKRKPKENQVVDRGPHTLGPCWEGNRALRNKNHKKIKNKKNKPKWTAASTIHSWNERGTFSPILQ